MVPTFLFVLCASAVVAVGLVSVVFAGGGGGASKAQKERLANRRAAVVEAKEKAAATVVPMPTPGETRAPARDEAA